MIPAFVATVVASTSGGLEPGSSRNPDLGERPNIVLVMTDDQGYGDFGFTGNPVIRTPHLDAMAGRSTRLERFYVSPVCTPTRASLMTGRDAQRTGAIDTYIGRARMNPSEVTIAEVLADAGYATGIFGKWHLGDTFPTRAMDQGFAESLLHRGGGLGQPSDPIENDRRYTDAIMFRDGERVETRGYCTDVQFDASFDFMARAVAEDRPFFAYIATNAPHGPFHDVPGDRHEAYAAMDLGPVLDGWADDPARIVDRTSRIYSMVENIDENMGRLFATLDRLDATEDTIVVFLCDNGPEGRRFVGPFRGSKSEVREGGIRTVSLWHRPGTFASAATPVLGAHVDVMPTILDLVDVETPEEVAFDGRSLAPWLQDPDRPADDDRRLVIQAHRGERPVRGHQVAVFEGPWKLSHQTGFGRETMPGDVAWSLHDIRSDPRERTDLAAARPGIVRRLRDHYESWFDELEAEGPSAFARVPIAVGSPRERTTVLSKQNWTRTAGNGWGRQGFWPLEILAPGTYDIQVVRSGADEPTPVTVRTDRGAFTGTFPPDEREAWIRGVRLEAGPTRLRCHLGPAAISPSEAAGHPAPYQVILHHRTDDP